MPDLSIKYELLSPSTSKTIEYAGPTPARIFKLAPELLMDVLGIDSGGLWEDEIRWDTTSDPVSFYGLWRAKSGKDKFSTVWLIIEAKGTQGKDKMGAVTIKIKGSLGVSFPNDNPLQKAMLSIYRHAFYSNHIRKYLDDANKNINDLEGMIRTQFDMMRREH